MKKIIKFLLASIFLTTVVSWSATLSTWHATYKVNEDIWIKIDVLPNERPEDWIGIFKVGDPSTATKLKSWKWVKNPGFDRDWYRLEPLTDDGKYEARYFINGTFSHMDASVPFKIMGGIPPICKMKTDKIPPYYGLGESVNIILSGCNSRNKYSWIGIFEIGKKSERKNLLKWKYIDTANTIIFDGLAKGNYEARLFKDGSYKHLLKSVKLSVGNTNSDIITRKPIYSANEDVFIGLKNIVVAAENKKKAWIGIYKAGTTSGVHNIIAKILVKDKTSTDGLVDWYKFSNINGGNYEARYFEDDTFTAIYQVEFSVRQAKVIALGTWQKNYIDGLHHNTWISLRNGRKDGGPHTTDWIGLYKVGDPSDISHLKQWTYTKDLDEKEGTSIDWFKFPMLTRGNYEARYFYDDNYVVKKIVKFYVDSPYGHGGQKYVDIKNQNNHFAVYHPTDWAENPTPVIFFLSALNQINATTYETLLKFIASYGYSVVFVPDLGTYADKFNNINTIIQTYKDKLDTSNIGIMGDLSGGGFTFKLLEDMIKKGYGTRRNGVNHRFLLSMDGLYAQFMNKENMKKLKDTNVILMQFGHSGNSTDPRIVLTNYFLLTGKNIDKNYIVLQDSPDHKYPRRIDIDNMQGLLKPLDAVMKYTFKEKTSIHHEMALEGLGKTDPYMNVYQKVLPISGYRFTCTRANELHIGSDYANLSDINNCGSPTLMTNVDF